MGPENAMSVESPCRRICAIDPETGFCIGCRRTRAEIAAWPRLADDGRLAILERLEERRSPLHGGSAAAMDCAACGACSGRHATA